MFKNNILKNVTLLLATIFLCFFLIEIGLRIFSMQSFPKGYYTIDDTTGLLCANQNYQGYTNSENGRISIQTKHPETRPGPAGQWQMTEKLPCGFPMKTPSNLKSR